MVTTLEDRMPADALMDRARGDSFRRAVLTLIAAIGTAIGWTVGRTFVAIGWVAGRVWLTLAFFTEAVIYGFQQGAKLPPKTPAEPVSPPRPAAVP